jgi:hypothetical protein
MSTTTPSVFNNRNVPLIAFATFIGSDESTAQDLAIQIYLCSPTLGLLTVKQSNQRNGPYQITDTFNYSTPDEMLLVTVPRAFAFYHVEFTNSEGNQTYLSLNTFLNSIYETSEFQVTNIVDISGNVTVSGGTIETTEEVNQIGSKGNIQNATFVPLASTNHFDCTAYGDSTLTYQDTSPASTGDMLIFVRVNDAIADSEVCIGKLIPIVNANSTNRYASTTLNLRAFNSIWVQNNSTTETNTNAVISLFSY